MGAVLKRLAMKVYTIKVVIEEGNDEFWEELERNKKSGCDEIRQSIEELVLANWFNATVTLEKFEDLP